MKSTILVISACLVLIGCTTYEGSVNSGRGGPEVVIQADVGAIKIELSRVLVDQGYTIEYDSGARLRFSRPLNSSEAQSRINRHAANRLVATFTFSKQPKSVRVLSSVGWSSPTPSGQGEIRVIDDRGKMDDLFQALLNELKEQLETVSRPR